MHRPAIELSTSYELSKPFGYRGEEHGKIIGIDLGTTNSCVSIMEGNTTRDREQRRCPHHALDRGVPGRRGNPRWRLGQAPGRDQSKNTLYAVKRLIGHKFTEKEVQKDIDLMPTRSWPPTTATPGSKCAATRSRHNRCLPTFCRTKMKKTAEDYLGEPVTRPSSPCPRTSTTHSARPQGRRPHCRSGRQAHHQRTHRCGPGLRPGQAGKGRPQDRRV